MSRILVAMGANASAELAANARRIARALRQMPGRVEAVSRLYRTPAWPPGAGNDFANAALLLRTAWPPAALLERLHRIEARHGRTREKRWGERVLDLDVVGAGGAVAPDVATWRGWADLSQEEQLHRTPDRLILPHPRMQDRAFVLIPLLDVAPDWRHPVTGRSVRAMVRDLSARERLQVRSLGPVDGVVNTKCRA